MLLLLSYRFSFRCLEALDLDPGLTERLRRRMATGEEDDAAGLGGGAALRGDGDFD